jgi:hypothetical protein
MEVETMKMVSNDRVAAIGHPGERGAALVTTLLIATLMMAAGGALLFTTAMSGITSSDSTTELQAYYGAEAGLQAAINVLRGNTQNPAGTKATFRNAADDADLSTWLTYNTVAFDGTSVVRVSDNTDPFVAYNLRIINIDNVLAPDEPQRLLVEVRGYGPRGSVKNSPTTLTYRQPSRWWALKLALPCWIQTSTSGTVRRKAIRGRILLSAAPQSKRLLALQ